MMSRDHTDPSSHSASQHELLQADPGQAIPQYQASDQKTSGQRRALALCVIPDVPKVALSSTGAGALALLLVEWKLRQLGDDNTMFDALSA
jgi:hypothetical protein